MKSILLIISYVFLCSLCFGQGMPKKSEDSLVQYRVKLHWYLDSLNTTGYCDSLIAIIDKTPCKVLALLQDSLFINTHLHFECFDRLIGSVSRKSNIHANWYHGLSHPYYGSLSLGRSLYKYDLILWNRHFGCPDTVKMKAKKYGKFNKSERYLIESDIWMHDKLTIDTAILD